jgi:hypothetical protein
VHESNGSHHCIPAIWDSYIDVAPHLLSLLYLGSLPSLLANHSSYWLSLYSLFRYATPLPGTLFDPCRCSRCRRSCLSFRSTSCAIWLSKLTAPKHLQPDIPARNRLEYTVPAGSKAGVRGDQYYPLRKSGSLTFEIKEHLQVISLQIQVLSDSGTRLVLRLRLV